MPRSLLGLLIMGLFCLITAPVSAAAPSGVTVAPAISNVELRRGQNMTQFNIGVANNTKSVVNLSLSSLDFKSLNQSGGVAFIGSSGSQSGYKYGLANWLILPSQPLVLQPGQTQSVTAKVDNRSDLAPGGHYAAVLFSVANRSPSGHNNVALQQSVSSLVFLRKIDGEHYAIKLNKPSLPVRWFRLPSNLDLFFSNTGNIQAVPRGLVIINSPSKKEVVRGIINTDSSLVLPESTRLYRTSLIHTSHAPLPGIYHVAIVYSYDGSPTTMSLQGQFLYLNLGSVFAILSAIAITAFGLRRLWIWRAKKRPAPAKHITIHHH